MASAYTLFCDDVRHEQGGKISYIGVYKQKMIIHSDFPVLLPKFVICVSFQEEADMRPDKVDLLIFLPGDENDKPSIQGEVSFANAEANNAIARLPKETPDRMIRAEAEIVLSPFVITQPGSIKVRFKDGDSTVRAGALIIERGPSLSDHPVPDAS